MREFLTLIGQIFFVACLQSIIELFIDPTKSPYQARLMSIACFLGSLYFIIVYFYSVLLNKIVEVFKISF